MFRSLGLCIALLVPVNALAYDDDSINETNNDEEADHCDELDSDSDEGVVDWKSLHRKKRIYDRKFDSIKQPTPKVLPCSPCGNTTSPNDTIDDRYKSNSWQADSCDVIHDKCTQHKYDVKKDNKYANKSNKKILKKKYLKNNYNTIKPRNIKKLYKNKPKPTTQIPYISYVYTTTSPF